MAFIRSLVLALLSATFQSLVYGDAGVPYGETIKGHFTYYAGAGKTACGVDVDRDTTPSVAISCKYWSSSNTNLDPVCHNNLCIKVDYKGKSITVPVTDQCCGCETNHIDLSKSAFKQLEEEIVGDAKGATWRFVKCDGSKPPPSGNDGKDDNEDGNSDGKNEGGNSDGKNEGGNSDGKNEGGNSDGKNEGGNSDGKNEDGNSDEKNEDSGETSGNEHNENNDSGNGHTQQESNFIGTMKDFFGDMYDNVKSFFHMRSD